MGETAAGLIGGGRINRGISLFDVNDLSILVDHECGAVAHTVGPQHAISFRGGAIFEIAEQRKLELELLGEGFLGGSVVVTDAKNEGTVSLEFRYTSLVCREFLGSATGKSGGKEREDDRILAFVVGQRDFAARGCR
jgi:hypothetical protein